MKKEMAVSIIRVFVLALSIPCVLFGCALFGNKAYLTDEYSAYYTGRVLWDGPAEGPAIVVLYAEKDGKYTVLAHDMVPVKGQYHLVAGDGPSSRKILAFEDANGNFVYDGNEKIGYLSTAPVNTRNERNPDAWVTIRIPASGGKAPPFPVDLSRGHLANAVNEKWSSRVGTVVSLGDSRFDSDNGVKGYSNPNEFLREFGPSLYMLEPYDSTRTPVLLVHGVKGTPWDLHAIDSSLDKKRFQVWVYFWPTGMPINFSAAFLEQSLQEMKEEHEFERIDIIAHSMGGLVSRAAINMSIDYPLPVGRFITISTPWNGHAASRLGVTMSPVIIPSWEDMVPDSYFLSHLFDTPLPPSTRHVLLFSYKGVNLFTPGNDDGCIAIESMLFEKAQERASIINGFNEDHCSILSADRLLQTIDSQMKQP
jgi:pimeloyl-ACP methyl ester carboxylesterase